MAKRRILPEDLKRFIFVSDAQISPDGETVLFSHKSVTEKNAYLTHIYTVDREGAIRQWTQGEKSCSHGRWSPDGSQIAFVSSRDGAAAQIYLISLAGGEAKKLSKLPEGSVGDFKWSPDGKWLALTFRDEIPSRTEDAKKKREELGLSEPPIEIDDIWYRLDGDGYFAGQRFRLMLLTTAGGEHRDLYTADPIGDYSFDWSPDSKELAVIHNATKRPMADPPNQQIWRVDLEGQAWKLEGLPTGEKSEPKWSPNGKWIAYAGNVDVEDPWGTRNTLLYVVDAKGGKPTDLTGATDHDLGAATLSDSRDAGFGASFEWLPDSSGLLAQVGTRGEAQLAHVTLKGKFDLLTEGTHSISMGNLAHDGRRVAATTGDATHLPEIAVIEPELGTGKMTAKPLTAFNAEFYEEVELSEPEEVSIPTTDGLEVHAWVMKPIGYLPPKRYPAVLEIHGGPHAQYGWAFFHEFQCLAAAGYVVVYSNPRGSKGYGEAWTRAIQGDWGNKDWEDIQAVTRWMQHQTYMQPGQMAVMGGSYGGYMTNWVIGHCADFKCAISDRCVSNMVSMAGNSDFPFNKDGYFKGVAWGSLEDIAGLWKQSPIAYFQNVKTPTLIIHSAGDLRCNIEQSEQVFTALQQQGIESRFVRYPSSTFHGMSRSGPPDLRLHRLGEIQNWLKRYLG